MYGGRRNSRSIAGSIIAVLLIFLLAACGPSGEQPKPQPVNNSAPVSENSDVPEPDVKKEPQVFMPQASGTTVMENDRAVIDYSNIADGYVMVMYKEETDKALKVQVKYSSDTYVYNIKQGVWNTFPLGNGNDKYTVQVCRNIEGKQYAVMLAASFDAVLSDEFAPFLRPNQYVNYENAPKTLELAAELMSRRTALLEKVEIVYNYIVGNFSYDMALAKTVQSGYLPDLDAVLEKHRGICFDYAAVMTAMLRSQGVPCKLVTGYAGEAYHAWISVWSETEGWIDGVIYFDGKEWKRMDPTFASTGRNDPKIHEVIGDGKNYREKHFY